MEKGSGEGGRRAEIGEKRYGTGCEKKEIEFWSVRVRWS
jgi:hypothetical protein